MNWTILNGLNLNQSKSSQNSKFWELKKSLALYAFDSFFLNNGIYIFEWYIFEWYLWEFCLTWDTLFEVGFFCPPGSTIPQSQACLTGHYCPSVGLESPTPCEPGSYQSATGRDSCDLCDAGSFCNDYGLTAVEGTDWNFYNVRIR